MRKKKKKKEKKELGLMAFNYEIKTKYYILPITLLFNRQKEETILTLEWRVQARVQRRRTASHASALGLAQCVSFGPSLVAPHFDAILVCKIRRY